jgi:hypothetical protein
LIEKFNGEGEDYNESDNFNKDFQKRAFLHGDSNRDQLVKICQVLGTEGLFKYLKKYNLKLDDDYYKMIGKFTM